MKKIFLTILLIFVIIFSMSIEVKANSIFPQNYKNITEDFVYDSLTAGFWTKVNPEYVTIKNSLLNITKTSTSATTTVYRKTNTMNSFEILFKVTYKVNYWNVWQIILGDESTNGKALKLYLTGNYVKIFILMTNGTYKQVYLNVTTAYLNVWLIFKVKFQENTKHIQISLETLEKESLINYESYLVGNFIEIGKGAVQLTAWRTSPCINMQFLIDYINAPFKTPTSYDSGAYSYYQNIGLDILQTKNTGSSGTYDIHHYIQFEDNLLSFSVVAFADIYTSSGYDEIGLAIDGFDGSSWNELASVSLGYDGAVEFFYGSGGSTTYYEKKPFGFQIWRGKDGYLHYEYILDSDNDGEFTIEADDTDMVLDNTQYYAYRIDVFAYLDSLHSQWLKVQYSLKTGSGYSEKPTFVKYETSENSFMRNDNPEAPNTELKQGGIFGQAIVWLYTLLSELAIVVIKWFYDALNDLWTNTFQGIYSYVSTMATDIWNKFSSYIDLSLSTINNTINIVNDSVNTFRNEIWNDFNSWFVSTVGISFADWFTNVYNWLDSMPIDIWNTFKSWFYNETSINVGDWFTDIYNNIKDIRHILWDWLSSQLNSLYGYNLYDFINSVYTNLNNLYSFFNDWYNFENWIFSMATSNFTWIVTWLPTFVSDLYDMLDDAYTFFTNNREDIFNAPYYFLSFFQFLMANTYWFKLIINILPFLWFIWTFWPLLIEFDIQGWFERILYEVQIAIQIIRLIMDIIDKLMQVGGSLVGGVL